MYNLISYTDFCLYVVASIKQWLRFFIKWRVRITKPPLRPVWTLTSNSQSIYTPFLMSTMHFATHFLHTFENRRTYWNNAHASHFFMLQNKYHSLYWNSIWFKSQKVICLRSKRHSVIYITNFCQTYLQIYLFVLQCAWNRY